MDKRIQELLEAEDVKQRSEIRLIPSENYTSKSVRTCLGSSFVNKYSEGYPGKRYYEGQTNTDIIETLAQDEAKKVFGCNFANVQPYSGSPANFEIYTALLNPGDKIMGLTLSHGGHLTHGHKVSATSKYFQAIHYTVDKKTHLLNFDEIQKIAELEKPQIIVAGFTAYPRNVDFAKFSEIAKSVGAYLLADISHISGLVAKGLHTSAFPYADVVMTTTHKMLRGPRGAMIMTNNEDIAKKIDKAVFPGLQGGPHMHTIAGIAQALKEAQGDEYTKYVQGIRANAKKFEEVFLENNIKLVTGGSDTHLLLIDTVTSFGLSGKDAAKLLADSGIILNANTIPYDPKSPMDPSGIRLGTPAITTVGADLEISSEIAMLIINVLNQSVTIDEGRGRVAEIVGKFDFGKY